MSVTLWRIATNNSVKLPCIDLDVRATLIVARVI
jgi:hypothetical protein